MNELPPAWGLNISDTVFQNLTDSPFHNIARTTDTPVGATWPYGCGWCGRSTKHDEVEICEVLQRAVHSDCHDIHCVSCAYLLCTDDRCADRDLCDLCWATVCKPHDVKECSC